MSDRIWGWLLHLYPNAFREKYRDEALQLYRDRLGEETGVYLRARLYCDLLLDAFTGLPQAWRNRGAVSIQPASVTHFDGVPSFQMLEGEPIRPATILLG